MITGDEAEKRAKELQGNYRKWKATNVSESVGFFPVFNGFRDLLRELSPGAVKLYIFLGLAMYFVLTLNSYPGVYDTL